jgi:hypothetical protein
MNTELDPGAGSRIWIQGYIFVLIVFISWKKEKEEFFD